MESFDFTCFVVKNKQNVLSFLNFFDKSKEKVNILKSFADIEYVSNKTPVHGRIGQRPKTVIYPGKPGTDQRLEFKEENLCVYRIM